MWCCLHSVTSAGSDAIGRRHTESSSSPLQLVSSAGLLSPSPWPPGTKRAHLHTMHTMHTHKASFSTLATAAAAASGDDAHVATPLCYLSGLPVSTQHPRRPSNRKTAMRPSPHAAAKYSLSSLHSKLATPPTSPAARSGAGSLDAKASTVASSTSDARSVMLIIPVVAGTQ